MAIEVTLPKLGLTMTEGIVEAWLVEDGAIIKLGDPLLRLATDKIDVDVEAEAEGIFHKAVPAGSTLPPGAVLGWLLADGEAVPTASAPIADSNPSTEQVPAPVAAPAPTAVASSGRQFVSPNARRVAGELGIDVAAVAGTGPNGRVVSEDVEAAAVSVPAPVATGGVVTSPLARRDAAAAGIDVSAVPAPAGHVSRQAVRDAIASRGASVQAAVVGPQAPTSVIPLRGMRGTIAARMVQSLTEMAQLTHGFEVRMDAVIALRGQLKNDWADTDLTVPSINDFIVRAAALALKAHPILNSTIVGNEIHVLPQIHMGLAVSVPGGLMVPVINNADELSLSELASETRRLATACREGAIGLDALEGATFAVTSLGTYGVDMFTPVINPGNVGILGVGRLRDGVEWKGETPVRTQVLTLSLTFDHRVVDGAPAAEYLQTIADLLARPLVLIP